MQEGRLRLVAALCLVMVIEGIMPFISPRSSRKLAVNIAQLDDRTLRIVGLFSMLVGVGLLTLIRG